MILDVLEEMTGKTIPLVWQKDSLNRIEFPMLVWIVDISPPAKNDSSAGLFLFSPFSIPLSFYLSPERFQRHSIKFVSPAFSQMQ